MGNFTLYTIWFANSTLKPTGQKNNKKRHLTGQRSYIIIYTLVGEGSFSW